MSRAFKNWGLVCLDTAPFIVRLGISSVQRSFTFPDMVCNRRTEQQRIKHEQYKYKPMTKAALDHWSYRITPQTIIVNWATSTCPKTFALNRARDTEVCELEWSIKLCGKKSLSFHQI